MVANSLVTDPVYNLGSGFDKAFLSDTSVHCAGYFPLEDPIGPSSGQSRKTSAL